MIPCVFLLDLYVPVDRWSIFGIKNTVELGNFRWWCDNEVFMGPKSTSGTQRRRQWSTAALRQLLTDLLHPILMFTH